jgi:hypothetical protein
MSKDRYDLNSVGKLMIKTLITELGKYGLGNSDLANSIQYRINEDILILDMNTYGYFVDSGTQPHMPPFDAINDWAKSKNLNTWAVMQNINKFGTKAQPFLYSIDQIIDQIGDSISDSGFDDFEADVDSIINRYFKKAEIK